MSIISGYDFRCGIFHDPPPHQPHMYNFITPHITYFMTLPCQQFYNPTPLPPSKTQSVIQTDMQHCGMEPRNGYEILYKMYNKWWLKSNQEVTFNPMIIMEWIHGIEMSSLFNNTDCYVPFRSSPWNNTCQYWQIGTATNSSCFIISATLKWGEHIVQ